MIFCFTLLATQSTKRGVHGLACVELNIVCSQRLFLGCKNQCYSFNFQVTFPNILPGLIFTIIIITIIIITCVKERR